MVEGYEICVINLNNDIGYYVSKFNVLVIFYQIIFMDIILKKRIILSFFVGINKILFFIVKCFFFLKNRDFVIQRLWLDLGVEKCIVNYFVNYKVNNRKSLLEVIYDF